jgi:hypothetical protein
MTKMKGRNIVLFLVLASFLGCGAAARRSHAKYAYAAESEAPGYYGGGGYEGEAMPSAPAAEPVAYAEEGKREMEKGFYDEEEEKFADKKGLVVAAEKTVPVGPAEKPPAKPSPGQGSEETQLPDSVVKGRVIIYEAMVSLAVYQVQEELEKIKKKIKEWDGYLISMNSNSIVFRVPVEKFDQVVDEVSGMGELISKDISGQDVTDEFRDLNIKLKNALAMRDRLVELLGKANTVKDSLAIEAELKRILEEIELLKGRIKFLQESALYSRITVYLESKESYKKPIPKLPAPLQWLQYELGINGLFE